MVLLLKKPLVGMTLLLVFVFVCVFTFVATSQAYDYRVCCSLYNEEQQLIGKGDWHTETYEPFCDCIKLDNPGPCNPNCVYFHIF